MTNYYGIRVDQDSLKYKEIKCITLEDSVIRIVLANGWRKPDVEICIWDAGQQCCESRFITCDDDLSSVVGADFINLTKAPAPASEAEDPDDNDEVGDDPMFLILQTDKGFLTFVTHNVHNGYYGGFDIVVTEARHYTRD
jgi:hypothetical protein